MKDERSMHERYLLQQIQIDCSQVLRRAMIILSILVSFCWYSVAKVVDLTEDTEGTYMLGGTEVDSEDGGQEETEELQCGMVEQETGK